MSRDVTVRRVEDEFVAISEVPSSAGELLTLERIVNDVSVSAQVFVVDSSPALFDGSVRHVLRLKPATRGGGRS